LIIREGVLSSEITDKLYDAMLFLDDAQMSEEMSKIVARRKMVVTPADTRPEWCMKVIAKLTKMRGKKARRRKVYDNRLSFSYLSRNRVMFMSKREVDLEEMFFFSEKSVVKITIQTESTRTVVVLEVFRYRDSTHEFEMSHEIKSLVYTEILKANVERQNIIWKVKGRTILAQDRIDKGKLVEVDCDEIMMESVKSVSEFVNDPELIQSWKEMADILVDRKISAWSVKAELSAESVHSKIKKPTRFTIMSDAYKVNKEPSFVSEDLSTRMSYMLSGTMDFPEIISLMADIGISSNESLTVVEKEETKRSKEETTSLMALQEEADDFDMGKYFMTSLISEDNNSGELAFLESMMETEDTGILFDVSEEERDFFSSLFDDMTSNQRDQVPKTVVDNVSLQEKLAFTKTIYSRMAGAFLDRYELTLTPLIKQAKKSESAVPSIIASRLIQIFEENEEIKIPVSVVKYLTQMIISRSRLSIMVSSRSNMKDVRSLTSYKRSIASLNFISFVGDKEELYFDLEDIAIRTMI
jgi:hypothetical protein